ncbi:MAG: hypothetical protein ACYC6C_13670 [Coriobacteriia bacterium]
MRNKIIYIIIFLILLAGIIYLIKYNTKKETLKTDTTYSTGNTQQLYKKGREIITTKTKTFHNAVILKPSAEDSTYNFTKEDSTYELSIKIKPAPDGNLTADKAALTAGNTALTMEYFLNLATKELIRIDTIYQLRVDTLKIKETILEKSNITFYNTLLFGAITTVLIIILILQFIP